MGGLRKCRSFATLRMTKGRGMTLLEVIVALTVAGGALAAGAAVLGFLVDQHARTSTEAISSAFAVRTTIRGWASSARLSTEGDAEFRGGPDGITFLTSAPTEVAPAGSQVRIYIDSTQHQGLVAEVTPWRRAGAPVVVSLAPDAVGFSVRYLGSVFGARMWQPGWISTSVLPAAIELRIAYDATRGTSAHALLAVPIIIPLAGRR